MKSIYKKMYSLLLLFIIVMSNISANKSNWASLGLNNDEIQKCINFQLTRGGTSLDEFEKIKPILNRFIHEKYNVDNLFNILGIPNQIVSLNQQTQIFYYLTADTQSCKLRVTVNKTQMVQYCVICCK